jgi:hypothetical protein
MRLSKAPTVANKGGKDNCTVFSITWTSFSVVLNEVTKLFLASIFPTIDRSLQDSKISSNDITYTINIVQ